jgi:hypothetical protein
LILSLGFSWNSLDFLVRNETFQRVAGIVRQQENTCAPLLAVRQSNSVKRPMLQPIVQILITPIVACILTFGKKMLSTENASVSLVKDSQRWHIV